MSLDFFCGSDSSPRLQVLHGHENNNNHVYSVYVTDYTRNEFLMPMSAAWCPPTLAPYVMRLEMWGAAAEAAREMQPHEFYAIDNVKMRVSAGGYWEGKFVESRKMRKLDVDELEGEPHLTELLEYVARRHSTSLLYTDLESRRRKKKWEEDAEEVTAHKFPHQLIAEAQLDAHFCCTVEVRLAIHFLLPSSLTEISRSCISRKKRSACLPGLPTIPLVPTSHPSTLRRSGSEALATIVSSR